MSKKKAAPAPKLAIDRQRAAERELNEAVDTAKRLKARSRDAKKKVKEAKKAAKEASKAAKAARKTAEKARRAYKKTFARAAKERKKAAKKRERIATPKRTTPSRNEPRSARGRGRDVERAHGRVWEVGEDAVDTEVPESTELDSDVPVVEG
jgi:uncharacterized protein with von Willebrand factor type A (vWA) domain